jgi:hypothetical protein
VKTCTACGHELGLGRFCTNCGHPAESPAPEADWRTDTAERVLPRAVPTSAERAAPPPFVPGPGRIPPAAVTPPPPPRYPLYADELDEAHTDSHADAHGEAVAPPDTAERAAPFVLVDEQVGGELDGPERRSWLTWVAAGLAMAVLAVGAYALWAFVLDDSDTPSGAHAADPASESAGGPTPSDVALQATARAPETAPPSEDVDGQLVSYDASNMLDGVPETAWRTEGDGTGLRLIFELAAPTRLTTVGILNGYAKHSTDGRGRDYDWYRGNRRVEVVVWDFGKGAKVRQELGTDREVQSMAIDPVTTRTVIVRLVQVSPPGNGRAARDYTAISEISLVGLPA